jgi:hypothetical protein
MTKGEKTVVILLVLAVACYLIYVQAMKWHKRTLEDSLEQSEVVWQTQKEQLAQEITGLKEELALKQEATLPKDRLLEVFGEEGEGMAPEQGEPSCEVLEGKIRDFFSYLDGRDYVEAYGIPEGTLAYFQRAAGRLAQNPPVVSAELKDPYLLLRNVAHFYRVLGKKGVRLTRDVILNESEIAEPVAALFFEWSSLEERCKGGLSPLPPLRSLYEYAGFFLNSLGGKSYLLRREPRVRILTMYYCLLILDRAIQEDLNRHGIDIRPHIDSVAEEVRNSRGLVYQKEYLYTLEVLQEKYTGQ